LAAVKRTLAKVVAKQIPISLEELAPGPWVTENRLESVGREIWESGDFVSLVDGRIELC